MLDDPCEHERAFFGRILWFLGVLYFGLVFGRIHEFLFFGKVGDGRVRQVGVCVDAVGGDVSFAHHHGGDVESVLFGVLYFGFVKEKGVFDDIIVDAVVGGHAIGIVFAGGIHVKRAREGGHERRGTIFNTVYYCKN